MTTNLTIARREVNTHPTEAQCKAGNYKMGHLLVNGFDITIENPKGSYRCGRDRNGKSWKCLMHNDYGYFRKTVGKDGDAVDVFLGPNLNSKKIFPIDQFLNGKFDETKVMMGFDSKEEAKAAYLSNYSADWKGFKYITEVDVDTFAKWLYDGHRQRKPFAKYMWLKEDKISIQTILNEDSCRLVSEGKRLDNDPNRKNKGVAKTPLKAIKAANRAEEIKAHGRSTSLRSMVTSKNKTKYDRKAFKKNDDFLNEGKTPIYKLTIDFSGYYNEEHGTFSDTAVAEILDYIKDNKISDALIRMDFYKKDKSDFEEYDIFCKKLQIKTLEYEVADSDRKVYRANITCDDQSATALIKLFVNLGAIGNGGHSFELSIDKQSFYFDGDGADRVDAVNGVKLRGKVLDSPHEWYEIKKKGEPQKEEEETIEDKLREMIREAILRELK